jgi:hypothetical protein
MKQVSMWLKDGHITAVMCAHTRMFDYTPIALARYAQQCHLWPCKSDSFASHVLDPLFAE